MSRLLVVGFVSLLAQVALLRELCVAFLGVELVYPLALAAWLLGTALGALLPERPIRPGPALLSWTFVALAILLPADAAFLRASRLLLGIVPGAYPSLLEQAGVLFASLVPVSCILGALFQWSARSYVTSGRGLALAYSIEGVGSVAGGMAATLLLAAGVPNLAILLIGAAVSALVPLASSRGWSAAMARAAAAALLVALAAFFLRLGEIDLRWTAWNHPALVTTADTPYGRLTVTSREGQVTVYENDALSFETEGTAEEEFVHIPALLHPDPRAFLVLGGGISGSVGEILKHDPVRVDVVELDRRLAELVIPLLPASRREPFRDPRVTLIAEDPRRFLLGSGAYDVILVGMPDPTSGQANRFYTKEFFSLCAARLTSHGVIAFRLGAAENRLTPPMARRLASICKAARASLDHILVLPGTTNIIIAARSALEEDARVLVSRLRERDIDARLVIPPYLEYRFADDRLPEINAVARAEDVPANTDAEPICYSYTLMIWLSRFLPPATLSGASDAIGDLGSSSGWRVGIAAGLGILLLAARLRPGTRRVALAVVAGAAGMLLETVILIQYQVKRGVLFQDIGILLTLFMAGLSAGALLLDRLARPPSPVAENPTAGRTVGRSAGWGLLLLLVALAALLAWAFRSDRLSGLVPAAAALGLAGFLVAGLFGYASIRNVSDQKAVISPLYAADILGGALAALVGTLLAVPALGLSETALWAAVLAAAAMVLV